MGAKPLKWRVIEKARNVHELRLASSLKAGSEAWQLYIADAHWDHPKCNLSLLKSHLDEARERGAAIVSVGDLFCAMQGKGDPRGDKESLRPEHQKGNYLDSLVYTSADWFAPYRDYFAVAGLGNHETSVYKHHETCLIERLCQSLRDKGGITRKGGYTGWIRSMFIRDNGRQSYSYRVFYHHGAGGGGPVTKGAIDYNRMAEYVDADAFVSGHVHWKNNTPVQRVRLNDASTITNSQMHYIRCGTYKDEWEDGHAGFHVEKGRGPRPLGGWWVRFGLRDSRLTVEWVEAKA